MLERRDLIVLVPLAVTRGMLLVSKKCHELIMINVLQFQPAPISELQLMRSAIKCVHSYKILGVHVSDDLTWNTQYRLYRVLEDK